MGSMLTGQALGFLNTLVSNERIGDPDHRITSIHIGNITPYLINEFIKSVKERLSFLLCEIDGIPIIMNSLCETEYVVLRNKHDFVPKEKEVLVDGVKPSKTWLKKYGIKR